MTDYSFDVILEVCVDGLIAFIGLIFVFGLNREGLPPGFRLLPVSTREWLIYYFHTLEALTLIGLWVCGIGHSRYIAWVFPMTFVSFALVFLSALVVWRWDHGLCYRELLFCFVVLLIAGLAFPGINASREA